MTHVHAPRPRRQHSDAFKTTVVDACCAPGASVAAVALAHGVNANLVRKWLSRRGVRLSDRRQSPVASPPLLPALTGFVPVHLTPNPDPEPPPPPPSPATAGHIRIELRRGETTVQIDWPVAAAGDCGAWLGEWLR